MPYSALDIRKVTIGGSFYFIIKDELGYTYIFDKLSGSTTTISNNSGYEPPNMDYLSQWYISKILAPDGNTEVEVEYTDDNSIAERESLNQVYSYEKYYSSQGCGHGNTNLSSMPLFSTSNLTVRVLGGGWLPSKIKTAFEDLDFFYKPRTDESLQLDSIALLSKEYALRQYWRLYHSYYSGGNKLRLDSISQVGGSIRSTHSFAYNSLPIPAKASKTQDHYGFYNGKTSNTTLIPKLWYNVQYIGNADREMDPVKLQAGILTR